MNSPVVSFRSMSDEIYEEPWAEVIARARRAGITYEVASTGAEGSPGTLILSLRSGRHTRDIAIRDNATEIAALLSSDFESWTILPGLLGYMNKDTGLIEVLIRWPSNLAPGRGLRSFARLMENMENA